MARARVIIRDVLRKRQQENKEYNDALAWTQSASDGKTEAGDIQLSLAMAAMFTTTELFRQLLIEIARHPELVEPLREEIVEHISKHGVSVVATSNMVLLDSFMKEAQRQSSGLGMCFIVSLPTVANICKLVVLERKALKDTALPNGRVIPRGSHIMVDSTDLWNPAVYPSPDSFDAYRFLRKRQGSDNSSHFVQSSPDYSVFGGGRHICPGRFFAANELKLALVHIILKYEVRLAGDYEPKNLQFGFYAVVDPFVQLKVRRRDETAANLLF